MNTKEKMEVMQAWLDGQTIEIKGKQKEHWNRLVLSNPEWDWFGCDYRIKPESQYRPFTNEELSKTLNKCIQTKDKTNYAVITYIDTTANINPIFAGGSWIGPTEMFENYKFYNPETGETSPCGVLVE